MNQYQQILESHKDLIFFSLDKNYCYLAFNQNHSNIMEYIWGEKINIGDNMLNFIHNYDDQLKAKNNFDQAISGDTFTLTEEYGDESLHRKYYENYYAPIKNETGKIEGVSIFVTDISDRIKKEIKVRKNEAQYRSLFENTIEGILVTNIKTHTFIYGNPAICKMLGYSDIEIRGKNLADIHPAKLLDTVMSEFEAFVKRKKRISTSLRFLRKDNTTFPATISTSLVEWDDQECLVGFISDTSERQLAEQKKQESEERYQKLFDSSKDAIMTLSPPSWNFKEGNSSILEMFRVKDLETWEKMGPWDVSPIVQSDGELSSIKAKECIEKAMKKGSNFFEWTHKRADGEIFPATVLLTRVDMFDHQFLQATVRDITHTKEAEETLRKQAAMQNILMDISSRFINITPNAVDKSINDSLCEIGKFVNADRAYIYTYDLVNKTCSNSHEWCSNGAARIKASQDIPFDEAKEFVEPHFNGEPVFIPDTTELIRTSKQTLISQNVKCMLTLPMINSKTCLGFVGFDSGINFHDYSNKEIGLLRLFADMLVNMNSQTQRQQELNKLLETTTAQNRRLKEFSFMTSHNIRASVANMIGLAGMLKTDPTNPKYLNLLETTTNKLDNTIGNINQLINFEEKVGGLENVPCNLMDVVLEVLKQTNPVISANQIEVVVDIPDNLSVLAFPAYIDDIFRNLITNAIKYGITTELKKINISAKKEKELVVVSVQDFGLGIDLEKHGEKIFRLGTRLHDHSDGEGLGLFMTKRQLEAMDGSIQIESQLNIGTTFKLYFNG